MLWEFGKASQTYKFMQIIVACVVEQVKFFSGTQFSSSKQKETLSYIQGW